MLPRDGLPLEAPEVDLRVQGGALAAAAERPVGVEGSARMQVPLLRESLGEPPHLAMQLFATALAEPGDALELGFGELESVVDADIATITVSCSQMR